MSRTLKAATLDDAEMHINNLNNQIYNLKSQLKDVDNRAKQATRDEAKKREKQAQEKHKKQQKQIRENRQKINNIFQKERDLNKQAELRLKNLNILLDDVDKKNNHEKFANGELEKIKRRVDALYNSSLPAESVIAQTLEITSSLYDLEEKISEEKRIFEAKHNEVLALAQELLKTMHDNRNELYYTDNKGEALKDDEGNKIQIEVDFWTENKYQKLEKRTKELEKELIEKKESVQLNDNRLDELRIEIENTKLEQDQLIILACEKGLASEQRIIISDDLVNAFMEQGFWLKNGEDSHNYMGSEDNNRETDIREGVMAVLKNGVGTEITLIVHPDSTGTKNQIIFHRNNNQNELTERQYINNLEKVKSFIESKGYKMGNLIIPSGTGDVRIEELADENALKKVGLKKELKKELGL